jgi:hypothetical protein
MTSRDTVFAAVTRRVPTPEQEQPGVGETGHLTGDEFIVGCPSHEAGLRWRNSGRVAECFIHTSDGTIKITDVDRKNRLALICWQPPDLACIWVGAGRTARGEDSRT